MENDFAKLHLEEERDQNIFKYYKMIHLLKKLNDIEITAEEYAVVSTTLKELNTEEIASFIATQTKQSIVLSNRWEKNIQSAIQFYETAHARDQSIEARLKAFHNNPKEDLAILVFGGFHKTNKFSSKLYD